MEKVEWRIENPPAGASGTDQVDLAPILGRGRALAGPIGIIVQMIRHLRRPEAADVTVVQVALDRLTQPGGPARRVDFPAGRKNQRTPHRVMRPLLRRRALLERE